MVSLTIASLLSLFTEEKKSTERGENHYKHDHIESVTYKEGVLRGEVHASMKKKVYKVTVSESLKYSIDRSINRSTEEIFSVIPLIACCFPLYFTFLD